MTKDQPLARKLGLALLVFYGLGNILGAGIYVLIGKVAETAGFFTPLSFLFALIVVGFTALSYTELVSRFPVAAGEAVYVQEGMQSQWLSIGVGLTVALAGVLSAAAIANGFSGYLGEFINIPRAFSAGFLIVIIGLIAIWGIGESVKIAAAMTLLEVGGLIFMIWIGSPVLQELPERIPELIPALSWNNINIIILGSFLAFYAFIGFEDMVNVAEEVIEPSKTFPKAIMITLVITTILYLLVSLISILLLSPLELALTDAPFALLYKKATGHESAYIITIIGLFATVNGVLIQMIMASRIIYGMSFKAWLPKIFKVVNSKTKTPINATLFVTFVVILLAIVFPIVELANATSSLILVIFTLVNIALIRIKLKDPKPENIYTVPFVIPLMGAMINIAFLLVQLFSM